MGRQKIYATQKSEYPRRIQVLGGVRGYCVDVSFYRRR